MKNVVDFFFKVAISMICVTLVSLRDSLTAKLSCDVWTGCSVQFVYVIVAAGVGGPLVLVGARLHCILVR